MKKAVLFDLGNTLVRYWTKSEAEVFKKILNSVGIESSLEEIKEALAKTGKEFKGSNHRSLLGKEHAKSC